MAGFGYLINPAGIFGAGQSISLKIKLGVAGIRLSARLDIFFNIHLPPGLFSYLIELSENFLTGGSTPILNTPLDIPPIPCIKSSLKQISCAS